MPATIETLFATRLYAAPLGGAAGLNAELRRIAETLSVDDSAGLAWCERHAYPGYTSYGSLNDLPWRFPAMKTLKTHLDRHVAAFVKDLAYDLSGRKITLDTLWVNVLAPGGFHTSHIHPHSVVSGTYYVAMPKGAAALKLEDPRLAMMMAAPPRKAKAPRDRRTFVAAPCEEGSLLLWESFLRHEVPMNGSDANRISVSFNYRWS